MATIRRVSNTVLNQIGNTCAENVAKRLAPYVSGLKKEHVSITIEGNTLSIHAPQALLSCQLTEMDSACSTCFIHTINIGGYFSYIGYSGAMEVLLDFVEGYCRWCRYGAVFFTHNIKLSDIGGLKMVYSFVSPKTKHSIYMYVKEVKSEGPDEGLWTTWTFKAPVQVPTL